MEDFRINKIKQDIELFLMGWPSFLGSVFLTNPCAQHDGPERVLDMLVNPETFFPFETESNKIWMIRRSAVKKAVVSAEFELALIHSYGKDAVLMKDVFITFTDGSDAHGSLLIEPRKGQSRVQDEANRNRPFVLIQCEEEAHLLGTSHIATIQELD